LRSWWASFWYDQVMTEQDGYNPEHGEPTFSHANDILGGNDSISSFEFNRQIEERGLHRVPAHGGGDVLMDEEEYRQFEQSELPLLMYDRGFEMLEDAHLVSEMLGGGPLAEGVEKAFKLRIWQLSEAMRDAQRNERYPVRPEEVARAQRDLYFMLSATAGALGARDFQTGIEERRTFVYPTGMKNMGERGREFSFDVCTDSFGNEGDFESDPNAELDPDEFRYWGNLKISINPDKRISFSYEPHQESAKGFHEAEDVVERDGRVIYHKFVDLNFRLDLDDKAPEGLSLDFGRGEFEGKTMLREGDLLGRVLSTVSPDGSHTYEGFRRNMIPELKPTAEGLMMQLQLQLQERRDKFPDEQTAGQIEQRLLHKLKAGDPRVTEMDDYLAERYRQGEDRRRTGEVRRYQRDLERYQRMHPTFEQPGALDQDDQTRAA
jgi:hypothetical protein